MRQDRGRKSRDAAALRAWRCSAICCWSRRGISSSCSAMCRSSSCRRPTTPCRRCWSRTIAGSRTSPSPPSRSSAAISSRSSIGIGIALLFSWFRTLEMLAMPLLVSLNMIPKVALGPLIIVWFSYGIGPNMMMAFAICFFPIVLTTARGLARGRARPARSGAHAERLALADLHQDPASRRAALHLLRHEGGGDPRGRRRHRRRVPRLRSRPRLPDAAGAGHARHRRHVHGGDPDHAASAWCFTAWCSASSACWSCATRAFSRRS